MKPGLTGLWQVSSRGAGMMHLHTDIDLEYIEKMGPVTDLKILLRTVPATLRRRRQLTAPGSLGDPGIPPGGRAEGPVPAARGRVTWPSARAATALPSGPPARPSRRPLLKTKLAEYIDSGDLTVNLTLRELRSRYKKSFLGWTWSLLNPLSTVIVYSIVFAFFLKIEPPIGDPSGLDNFAAFLLCGLLPWNYLQGGMNGSMGSLIGNANLIKKVYFPREVFVVSAIGSLLVSFLIELGVLAVILLIMGNMVLPWIPVVLVIVVIQSFFVLGIGFLLSVLNVYFRDVQHLVSIALDGALLLRADRVPDQGRAGEGAHRRHDDPAARDLRAEPARRARRVLPRRDVRPAVPAVLSILYLIGWSIVLMAIGLAVFQKLDRRLAEEV